MCGNEDSWFIHAEIESCKHQIVSNILFELWCHVTVIENAQINIYVS